MVRLVRVVLVLALLGGVGVAAWRDVGGIRTRAAGKVTAWIDRLLGAPHETHAQKDRPAAAPVKKAIRTAAPPAIPSTYVDRSPTPSALERVKPEDRQRLDQLIAARTEQPGAAGDNGAKRVTPGTIRPAGSQHR